MTTIRLCASTSQKRGMSKRHLHAPPPLSVHEQKGTWRRSFAPLPLPIVHCTLGAVSDYTKYFDLIPQAISLAILDLQGMAKGMLRVLTGMYAQLVRVFKIKGLPKGVVARHQWHPPRVPRERDCHQRAHQHLEMHD